MNVLVVDDQRDVVNGIRDHVSWDQLPVSHVYTATGSAQAREILKKTPVDILLCDIEMPRENGLELCRWAREAYPDLQVIFLTSHADFDYAQTALKLGSFDYILQPAPYAEITRCVGRLCETMIREREVHRHAHEGIVLKQRKKLVLKNALSELTVGGTGENTLEELLPLFLRENYRQVRIFPVLMAIHWLKVPPEDWRADSFAEALEEQLCQTFAPLLLEAVVAPENDTRLWIFICGESGRFKTVNCVSGLVRYKEAEKAGEFYTTLYYKQRTEYAQLPLVMGEILEKARDKVAPPAILYDLDQETHDDTSKRRCMYLLHTQRWAKWLVDQQGDQLKNEIMSFFEDEDNRSCLDRETLRFLYFRLVEAMLEAASRRHIKLEQIFPSDITLKIFSEGCITYSHFMGCVDTITAFFANKAEGGDCCGENTIEQAVLYIKDNLDQNLTRNDVASAVHLNPEYFSRLFKKQTGYTVADFIFREKMKMARELLKIDGFSISMIAVKVGYSNFSHFTQLFKKVYGMTPNEYRKTGGNGLDSPGDRS